MPVSARWPEVTVDVAVGQMRQMEFLADEEGDWAIHCHKSHHTMNAMGHNVPTMIGVETGPWGAAIQKLIPDYMDMGSGGMHEMSEMGMPLPTNTLPMMTGQGPFGSLGMGGMFSVLKVRKDQKRGDYTDPGWFHHPPGSVAQEHQGLVPEAERRPDAGAPSMTTPSQPRTPIEVQIRKPHAGGHH